MEPKDTIQSWPHIQGKVKTSCGVVHVTQTLWQNEPFMVILQMGKSGSCHNCFMEAIGRLLSWGLQAGGDIQKAAQHLMGLQCSRPFGDQNLSCLDGLGKLLGGTEESNREYDITWSAVETDPSCPKGG